MNATKQIALTLLITAGLITPVFASDAGKATETKPVVAASTETAKTADSSTATPKAKPAKKSKRASTAKASKRKMAKEAGMGKTTEPVKPATSADAVKSQ